MGGVVCQIHVKSILQFDAVPTDAALLPAFDEQMRRIHQTSDAYKFAIVNETDDAAEVCKILEKTHWTNADRQKLLNVVNEICGPYP